MSPDLHRPTHRPSLVARVPLRAARWSATHPWRAIGAWFAFVAIAVALAALIPTKQTTDADYRLGESGRADAMAANGRFADDQVESVLITGRDGRSPSPDRGRPGRRAAHQGPRRRPRRHPGGRPAVERRSCRRADRRPPEEHRRRRVAGAGADRGDRPRPRRPPGARGRRRLGQHGHQRPRRRGPALRRGDQPADHAPADAARLRCADRRRRPGPARHHLGRRHDGHRRTAVAPDPRRAHREQHDRADRHGGRRRLLAVLPQARARGAGQGAHAPSTPSRSPPRRRATRSWSPGAAVDRLDGRPVHRRRRDLQLARRRRHRRGRRRRDRLGHRAAGAAGQARPLGRPSADPAAVAGQPADRTGRHQPSHPGSRRTPPGRGPGRLAGRAGRPRGSRRSG